MRSVFAFFIFLAPKITFAAACCGGGFAFPSLILNDDKHQLTLSLGHQTLKADALSGNEWIRRNDNNATTNLKIDAATIFGKNLQFGASTQASYKTNNADPSSYNLGDSLLFLAHETFPELYFSRWKPHGITFLQLSVPTGTSIYEETQFTKLDGKGFYSLGAGLALTKSFKIWDFNFNADIHKSFARSFTQQGESITVKPSWGSIQTLGAGYNVGNYRVGTYISHSFEDKMNIEGSTNSSSLSQTSYTVGLVANYMLSLNHAFTFNYSNQTLLGKPQNTGLTEGITLSYQHRWNR